MLKLEDIRPLSTILGIAPNHPVRIVGVDLKRDSLIIYYEDHQGKLSQRELYRSDEHKLALAPVSRIWSFDGSPQDFKLATEAYRIKLAHLFDPMMAVHIANVDPLPHQIAAVYESMLPSSPLRFLLADDPGAGKTVMAGLYIQELILRADAQRVLIVCPGGLTSQWQDELKKKFNLDFDIFASHMLSRPFDNPFERFPFLIVGIDQISRFEERCELLKAVHYDLVVVDEAHKLSARWEGSECKKTKRFKLGEILRSNARHFLLMTATPHNGKEEDFQLFLSLLDEDSFYSKYRRNLSQSDLKNFMRRMIKEELVTFDGTPLFPPRIAETASYALSDLEKALYERVTEYVREQMNNAERLEKKRQGTIGFALTILQRRLASSPKAILESLKGRQERLEELLKKKRRSPEKTLEELSNIPEFEKDPEEDEYESEEEYEEFEEKIVGEATASQTIRELEAEIALLAQLVKEAGELVLSNRDRKWEQLSSLIQDNPEMKDLNGRHKKLIIFTEHRATLAYLKEKIGTMLGGEDFVVSIEGKTKRTDRQRIAEDFQHNPHIRVLIGTDAVGEGVNLQKNVHLMVNYDLPWNPNRLEQRFGRIHRIGQTEICRLWNLVASNTREGEVFKLLLEKLDRLRRDLGGKAFDILGQLFPEASLRGLLVKAVREGSNAVIEQVESPFDEEKIKELLERNALSQEIIDTSRLLRIKEDLDKAEARKLQPHFIKAFFLEAFKQLDGQILSREQERFEVLSVPQTVQDKAKALSHSSGTESNFVSHRYERVCFDKKHIGRSPQAQLVHAAHPLLRASLELILSQKTAALQQGAVLTNPSDWGTEPKILFLLEHAVVRQSSERIVSKRLQFLYLNATGTLQHAGSAPHLDLEPIKPEDLSLLEDRSHSAFFTEKEVLTFASESIARPHLEEICLRIEQRTEKSKELIHRRLQQNIDACQQKIDKIQDDLERDQRHDSTKRDRLYKNLERIGKDIEDLRERRNRRIAELEEEKNVVSTPPRIISAALVIPEGLIAVKKGETSVDQASNAEIEQIAMQAVIEAERAMGHEVTDVSRENCGWDITSIPPSIDGKPAEVRHIEIKGRIKDANTITVSKNEYLTGLNQENKFILAIVLVDGNSENVHKEFQGPYYIRAPFNGELQWDAVSINLDLRKLIARAETPINSGAGAK